MGKAIGAGEGACVVKGEPNPLAQGLLRTSAPARAAFRPQVRKMLGCLWYIHSSTLNSTGTKDMLVLSACSSGSPGRGSSARRRRGRARVALAKVLLTPPCIFH